MKEKLLLTANIGLFALVLLALGTMQTSLWFQVFGYFPAPALWLPCLVYVAINRSTLETVLFCYLAAFILSTMTAMPEGILMVVVLGLGLSAQVFKNRIFWTGSSYIMMMCGFGALLLNVYHLIATFMIGDLPLTSPRISDWLIEALLTPLVAPGIYPVFRWIDYITNREQPPETSAQVS